MNIKEWRALIRKLRKRFPVGCPVKVIRRAVKCDCGLTVFDGRRFRVRINALLDIQGQVDTLLHEWAHLLAIEEAYEHYGRWAEMHGKIYDAWQKGFKQ